MTGPLFLAGRLLVGPLIRVPALVQTRASGVRAFVGGHDCNGRLQGEVQHGFRRQLDLLTFRRGLHATTKPAPGRGPDGSTLAAAGNCADDCADTSAGSNFLGRVLASRRALAAILVGLDVVILV